MTPSQLFNNDKISFVVAKPFLWRDTQYEMGDDFPQEEANNVETMIRSRFIIPVVDDINDKPRHWHREVRPRDEVLARLRGDTVQIVLPMPWNEDLETLTYPELTPEPTEEPDASDADSGVGEAPADYDPGEYTVAQVQAYVQQHPEQAGAVLESERTGRDRSTLVAWLEGVAE
jgi:hypothetical protein